MTESELRGEMVRITKKLDELGLNRGTSGNLSVRFRDGMLITPSGMGAEGLGADDIVFVHMDGTSHGRWQPSSEWLFHRDILAQRPDAGRWCIPTRSPRLRWPVCAATFRRSTT